VAPLGVTVSRACRGCAAYAFRPRSSTFGLPVVFRTYAAFVGLARPESLLDCFQIMRKPPASPPLIMLPYRFGGRDFIASYDSVDDGVVFAYHFSEILNQKILMFLPQADPQLNLDHPQSSPCEL
jgi:hypothetical protein